ncbi:hypothetical protein ACP4IX_15350 [Streptomyces sp. WG5]
MSYHETETYYVAASSVEDARQRHDHRLYGSVLKDTPAEAWDALGYFEREESGDEYEVFKFVTTTQVTKVDPPYTRSPK